VAPRLLRSPCVTRFSLLTLVLLAATPLCRAAGDGSVLDEINLARTQPRQYAEIVATRMRELPGTDERCVDETVKFLMRQAPLAPLRSVSGLMASARIHVADQSMTGEIGHRDSDGAGPVQRIDRCGVWSGCAGEDISYGYPDARSVVVTLIVDQGVPGKGHRKNIFSRDFHVAGVASGGHARYGSMCVIDFAGDFVPKGAAVATTDAWRAGPAWDGF
jgi:uncharacterized protein YkwD